MKTYDVIEQTFKELNNGLMEAKCVLLAKSISLSEANHIKKVHDSESVSILEHPGGVRLIESQKSFMKGEPISPVTFY